MNAEITSNTSEYVFLGVNDENEARCRPNGSVLFAAGGYDPMQEYMITAQRRLIDYIYSHYPRTIASGGF